MTCESASRLACEHPDLGALLVVAFILGVCFLFGAGAYLMTRGQR